MTTDVKTPDPLRDTIRAGARDASAASWWLLALGSAVDLVRHVRAVVSRWAAWSRWRRSSASRSCSAASPSSWWPAGCPTLRWLSIVGGILGIAAGIVTFAWPGITLYVVSILVAWYLIVFGTIHIVSALAGPKLPWWWTGLLLGTSELVLGVWAARSWEHSLVTLVTLVGVWAICRGVNEIFAGFALRQVGKQADRLVA